MFPVPFTYGNHNEHCSPAVAGNFQIIIMFVLNVVVELTVPLTQRHFGIGMEGWGEEVVRAVEHQSRSKCIILFLNDKQAPLKLSQVPVDICFLTCT